jgi:hypothetical protein
MQRLTNSARQSRLPPVAPDNQGYWLFRNSSRPTRPPSKSPHDEKSSLAICYQQLIIVTTSGLQLLKWPCESVLAFTTSSRRALRPSVLPHGPGSHRSGARRPGCVFDEFAGEGTQVERRGPVITAPLHPLPFLCPALPMPAVRSTLTFQDGIPSASTETLRRLWPPIT